MSTHMHAQQLSLTCSSPYWLMVTPNIFFTEQCETYFAIPSGSHHSCLQWLTQKKYIPPTLCVCGFTLTKCKLNFARGQSISTHGFCSTPRQDTTITCCEFVKIRLLKALHFSVQIFHQINYNMYIRTYVRMYIRAYVHMYCTYMDNISLNLPAS